MRIGDLLFFAPGLRFDQVDLDGSELPEQFRQRIEGLYIRPAEECAGGGHAFAAGVLLVSCIDALAKLRFGNGVGERFRRFAREELKSFASDDHAQRFYEEFRNGLVHEARLKEGAQFSLEIGATVQNVDGLLLVNPELLAAEVRSALDNYVRLARDDTKELAMLRQAIRKDNAKDFLFARGAVPPNKPLQRTGSAGR